MKIPAQALALLACSCRVGPEYEAPELTLPEQFDAAPVAQPASVDAWWETFDDPPLQRCIEEAFRSNLDAEASLERVRTARALRRVESSRYYPEIDARLSYTEDRLSANNPRFGDAIDAGIFPRDVDYWETGFDVSWELDVFGGTQRRVEAAVARIEEQEYQRGALLLSLAAEVARNYFELRGNQQRLELLGEQIANEEARTALLEKKRVGGLIPADRVLESRTRKQQLQARGPALEAEVRAAAYRLAVLMGRRPQDFPRELDETRPLPPAQGHVPVGLPSELLLRRPDVHAAERRLAAASADIGVASANAFPRFFLTGAPYLQSSDFGDLFSSASTGWIFGPSVKWNLFSAGRNKALVQAAESQERQVFLEYEATVNRVLEEVESSLVRYAGDAEALGYLTEAERSRERNAEIRTLRLERGMTDRLEVLETRGAWLDARMNRLDQELRLLGRLVSLYKALGGGWETAEEIALGTTAAPEPTRDP